MQKNILSECALYINMGNCNMSVLKLRQHKYLYIDLIVEVNMMATKNALALRRIQQLLYFEEAVNGGIR